MIPKNQIEETAARIHEPACGLAIGAARVMLLMSDATRRTTHVAPNGIISKESFNRGKEFSPTCRNSSQGKASGPPRRGAEMFL